MFLKAILALPKRLLAFMREAREELKKVSWPSRQTTTRYTGIVIIASLVVGAVIGGLDYLLTLALERLILK